jgi:hypothetical protein
LGLAQFKRLGLKPKQKVEDPQVQPPPEGIEYLWLWFGEIMQGVAANGMAPLQMTWETLRAWKAETLTETMPWESRALIRLGACYANVTAEKIAKQTKKP